VRNTSLPAESGELTAGSTVLLKLDGRSLSSMASTCACAGNSTGDCEPTLRTSVCVAKLLPWHEECKRGERRSDVPLRISSSGVKKIGSPGLRELSEDTDTAIGLSLASTGGGFVELWSPSQSLLLEGSLHTASSSTSRCFRFASAVARFET